MLFHGKIYLVSLEISYRKLSFLTDFEIHDFSTGHKKTILEQSGPRLLPF